MITSYFIDDEGTLHTFIDEKKHITFSNVESTHQAEMLIEEENRELLLQSFNKEKVMFQVNAKLRRKRIMFQIEEFEMGNISVYTLIKKIKEILNEDRG